MSPNIRVYAMFAVAKWRQIRVERSGTAYMLLGVVVPHGHFSLSSINFQLFR